MPAPVSTFSPFTPFTPASSTASGGGYFDRPAAGNMGISSPLGRRPDMRNSGVGSSTLMRMSRVSGTSDSLRTPAENGWKMASRMRDEAWSAWEQQLGNLSISQTNRITLSSDTLMIPRATSRVRHTSDESHLNKPRAPVNDGIKRVTVNDDTKTSSKPPRFPSELLLPQMAPGPFRSISSNGTARPPKLGIKRRSFDPSFFPNHAHFHEAENVRVN